MQAVPRRRAWGKHVVESIRAAWCIGDRPTCGAENSNSYGTGLSGKNALCGRTITGGPRKGANDVDSVAVSGFETGLALAAEPLPRIHVLSPARKIRNVRSCAIYPHVLLPEARIHQKLAVAARKSDGEGRHPLIPTSCPQSNNHTPRFRPRKHISPTPR